VNSWRIVLAREAASTLRRLDRPQRIRVRDAMDRLSQDPRTPAPGRDVRRLEGVPGLWRLRVGRWRVLFTVDDAERVVYVVAVRPRGQAYTR
jgi:mRNA interferase RelE/StbE